MASTTSARVLVAVLCISCKGAEPSLAASDASSSGEATPDVVADQATADGSGMCVQPPANAQCTNGWCRIEPGCFIMGAPRGEFGAAAYADAQVVVTLTHPFLMQRTETTQKMWKAAGFTNPSGVSPSVKDCEDLDCPVGNVTFAEAASFANAVSRAAVPPLPECYVLSGCTGAVGGGLSCDTISVSGGNIYQCKGFRLPTEAEWEYAARAGTPTAFYSGAITVYPERTACNPDPALEAIGWYCQNSGRTTHTVGLKAANSWGLVDMSGNAAEWVNDFFDGLGYGSSPAVDPTGSLRDTSGRVVRGGGAATPAVFCKSSYRDELPASVRSPGLGFRLARTVSG